MPFEKNVFINCPFDFAYKPILDAVLFALVYIDMEPKISETTSSEDERIKKIKKLIAESKYGIHDLSRSVPLKMNDLPRFNMPYELGLDVGCIKYKGGICKQKKILIFNSKKYRIQKVLSDINGKDIEIHNDDPEDAILCIRNWFYKLNKHKVVFSGTDIWTAYNNFKDDFNLKVKPLRSKKEINRMPRKEYIDFCKEWIKKTKGKPTNF